MRLIVVVLVALLVVLQIQFWHQHAQVRDLRDEVRAQRELNGDLGARNDALSAEVADLKTGLDAVEERARTELGLIRDGETFYLVVDPSELPEGQPDALRRLEELPAPIGQPAEPDSPGAPDADPDVGGNGNDDDDDDDDDNDNDNRPPPGERGNDG